MAASIVRSYPKPSLVDSMRLEEEHCCVFYDQEIREIHPIIRREIIGKSIEVKYSENKVPILQQQARRGCTAAAAAMLILQHEKFPDLLRIMRCELGNKETIQCDLSKSGLQSIIYEVRNTPQDLRVSLLAKGSGIIGISDCEVGGHEIVIDDVSEDLMLVRLRDPYHGWEISIDSQALIKRLPKHFSIIQIRS